MLIRPDRPKAAIYFQMFSPYIVARLNAAAAQMQVIGIEGSRRSTHYAWEPREGADRFDRATLFRDEPVEDLPASAVAAAMRTTLESADPDVVVANGWSRVEALTMLDWARQNGRHAIVMSESARGDSPRTWLREAIKRVVVQQFDAALVGGTPHRDYIEKLGMAAERVFIGYDVVDNDFWSRQVIKVKADPESHRRAHNLPQDYFLASARFIGKKNLDRLIEAFGRYYSTAGDDAWKLVLLGDGKLRGPLMEKVAALHLEDAVVFAGFQQIDTLPIYYALAGSFVHVSIIEQWGLVVNEAMACGLPVIVSETCGCARDLVRNGRNGFIVNPYDIGQIANRLHIIAAEATLRRTMGEKSKRIMEDFSPVTFATGLTGAIGAARSSPPKRTSLGTRLLIRALASRGGETGG